MLYRIVYSVITVASKSQEGVFGFFFFQEMIEILPLLVSGKLCTAYFSVQDSSGKVVNFFFVMQQVGCWFASYRPR